MATELDKIDSADEVKHTPLPWEANGNGVHRGMHCVAIAESGANRHNRLAAHANAEFIARAANSHYELLALCEAYADQTEGLIEEEGDISHKELQRIRAAIAKAKGELSSK